MDVKVVSLICFSILFTSSSGEHKVDEEAIAAWNTAVASGDVEKVKELIQVPIDKLKDAATREQKLRELLEPIDENFKYWMEWGVGVDHEAMLDALHSVPLVVYRLDAVSPIFHAYAWIDERLQNGGTVTDHESRVWLERSEWLLKQKMEKLQRLEDHLYSLNRLTGHRNEHVSVDRELGRLGIAFYSELGTLPWKESNVLGTPDEAINKFLEVYENEVKAGTFNQPQPESVPQVQSMGSLFDFFSVGANNVLNSISHTNITVL